MSADVKAEAACFSLATLNGMTEAAFTEALAGIYEHAPWVAREAAAARPFASFAALREAMALVVSQADAARKTALLNAHPELGQPGPLTAASTLEQRHGGFDRMPAQDAEQWAALNAAYRKRFGFPFIIAVRGQRNAQAIMEALRRRMAHQRADEEMIALGEVMKIADFRLRRCVEPTDPPHAGDAMPETSLHTT
jgi:2-oxo-4-hydroxy-4-carboxy-5-ureidoimidazoline decarboxylase